MATGSRILVPFKKPLQYYIGPNADVHPHHFSAKTLAGHMAQAGFRMTDVNRFIDSDYLVMVGEKTDRTAPISWEGDNATAVLDQLGQQRGALKGVHKRVLDLATTLGVSNSVMKMIERRQFLDKLLVYGGMLAVLALLWFVHRVRISGAGEEGES